MLHNMATSGHESPPRSKGRTHDHGVRIDSSLINTGTYSTNYNIYAYDQVIIIRSFLVPLKIIK